MEPPEELDAVAANIVGHVFRVRQELGVGLYESAYARLLCHALVQDGHAVQREVPLRLEARGCDLGLVGRADALVDGAVLLEFKAVPHLHPIHTAQLLTYLRLAQAPLGFLVNFHAVPLREGINRHVHRGALEDPAAAWRPGVLAWWRMFSTRDQARSPRSF